MRVSKVADSTNSATSGDGNLAIVLDHHEHVSEGAGPHVVSAAQFEKWWVPVA